MLQLLQNKYFFLNSSKSSLITAEIVNFVGTGRTTVICFVFTPKEYMKGLVVVEEDLWVGWNIHLQGLPQGLVTTVACCY